MTQITFTEAKNFKGAMVEDLGHGYEVQWASVEAFLNGTIAEESNTTWWIEDGNLYGYIMD